MLKGTVPYHYSQRGSSVAGLMSTCYEMDPLCIYEEGADMKKDHNKGGFTLRDA